MSEVHKLNILFAKVMKLLNNPCVFSWNFIYQLNFL